MSTAPVIAYTDGACSGNPGPGGWAWAVPGGAFAAGHADQTTNQRMEITAAFEAAVAHPGRLEIVTDSTYVMNCFVKRWYVNWLKTGWKNSQKKAVANRDLWEPFVELYVARDGDPEAEITFRWVKGHSGDAMNDLVDRLAVDACATQRPRSGSEPPDPSTLGEPDAPGPRRQTADGPAAGAGPTQRDGRVPVGRRLVVLGHRPPELGGYDEPNPIATAVRRTLAEIIGAKAKLHPDLVVLSGLRLGAEMLGAEAAIDAGVPFVAVLPYPEPESVWSAPLQQRFRALVARAERAVTLERKVPADRAGAGKALARRDGWLAATADEALVVWDGDDPSLAKLDKTLRRHLTEEDIWVVAPPT